MEQDHATLMKTEKHASNATSAQVRSYFPQPWTAGYRSHSWHPDGPQKLNLCYILTDGDAILVGKLLQPLSDRLRAA
jgi:hypothetical protein